MTAVSSELSGDGRLEILIDRPEAKNAFTNAMYEAFIEILGAAAADPAVGCVLIRGTGGAFSAGNDMGEFISDPPLGQDAPAFRFLRSLAAFEKVLIVAVDGVAVGIGATMLLHCDLVVASSRARFAYPFVNLAIIPEAASSLLLPRLVGRQRGMELLLLGEPIDAATALGMGLVNRVVDEATILEEARALAAKILSKPPRGLSALKRLVAPDLEEILDRMARENEAFGEQVKSAEAVEAISAFREKRKPVFAR